MTARSKAAKSLAALHAKVKTVEQGRHRDYQRENIWKSKPEQIRKRVARNKARRKAMAEGKVRKWDTLTVHHKDGNVFNQKASNIAVVTKAEDKRMHKRMGKPIGQNNKARRKRKGKTD